MPQDSKDSKAHPAGAPPPPATAVVGNVHCEFANVPPSIPQIAAAVSGGGSGLYLQAMIRLAESTVIEILDTRSCGRIDLYCRSELGETRA